MLPAEAPFDLLFADGGGHAMKTNPAVLDLLAPGGTLVLDNLTPGRAGPDPVRELWLGHPRLVGDRAPDGSRSARGGDRRGATALASAAADRGRDAGPRGDAARPRQRRADLVADRSSSALSIYLIWRSLQYMPRVKPQAIESDSSSSVTWADVAGVEEAKAELQEVVDFLKYPKRFQRLGARVPKGMLLYGPPGTGKTLLAKAVAHESGAKFYSQSASAFVEMFAGLGASRIRKLFQEARKNAPAIIFIDELDAVGTARSGDGFNREHDQTLNQLLVELDGFDESAQVVVMGASNRLQDLDPALRRPGRFDRQVLVSPPDLVGRQEILRVHTRGKPLAEGGRSERRRAPDRRTDRRRARQHLQRGGDLRRPPRAEHDRAGRLRGRDGAGDRRSPAAPRRHRQGEADPRLPRGRPRPAGAPDGRPAARSRR